MVLLMLPMMAMATEGDSLYVYFNGYRLDVFPSSYIQSQEEINRQLRVTVLSDTTYCYDLDRIDSISHVPTISLSSTFAVWALTCAAHISATAISNIFFISFTFLFWVRFRWQN